MRLKLPISISDFYTLRTENYLYIDKTNYIYQLFAAGHKYYFLARPRRFGKSLLVSSLYAALAGHKTLFTNLALANTDYHWTPHGIIYLDFSIFALQDIRNFNSELSEALVKIIDQYQLAITIDFDRPIAAFRKIVDALHTKFGRVAILIDEYDSPIMQKIEQPEQAVTLRDNIQALFRTIKGLGRLIDFVFITGVTSFSKAGLFSGLNNLDVLTLDAKYNAICGYTDAEIDTYFAPYLADWAQKINSDPTKLRAQLRAWYNGYRFSDTNSTVYNPFSITNAFDKHKLQNFWIQSGTPTFLVNELKKRYRASEYQLLNPERFTTTSSAMGSFDIGLISIPALMFQTGYLTITDYEQDRDLYKLGYPNYEVRMAAQNYLLAIFTNTDTTEIENNAAELWTALNEQALDEAIFILRLLFAKIPYPLHIKLESFYHSLLQMICHVANIKSQSEYATSHGSIDLVLEFPKVLYIVEIKFNDTAQTALQQIIAKRYYEPFMNYHQPIILLGLNFSKTANNFELTYVYQKFESSHATQS